MSGMQAILKKYSSVINKEVDRHFVSLGPVSVNLAVGDIRGVESGRIVQLVGREGSGKTTLAMDIVAQYQRDYPGKDIMWVDYERTFDDVYAKAIGIDVDEHFYRLTPDDAEQGYDIVLEGIKAGVKLIVVDSVATSIPSAEAAKQLQEHAKMAGVASILTRFCQHVIPLLWNYDATIIMINQYRKNFSALSPVEEVPFGGMALLYATSVLLALAKIKTEDTRQRVQAIVRKNKVARPMIRSEYDIVYGAGVDHPKCLIDMACEFGIISKAGSWFRYNDFKAQGVSGAAATFPLKEIQDLIIETIAKQEAEIKNAVE